LRSRRRCILAGEGGFTGPVERVWYDNKGYPFVIVNGREYYLGDAIWHFNVKIHKGDTIVKQKGDLRIKIIKPHTKDTIYYNSVD